MKRINGNAERRRRENQGAEGVGCGEGRGCRVPLPTEGEGWGGAVPPPQKNFWFWLSIWWVLVHSGRGFFTVQLPVLQAKPEFNRYRRIKAVMVTGEYRPRWDSARPWSLHSLPTLRLGWTMDQRPWPCTWFCNFLFDRRKVKIGNGSFSYLLFAKLE